MVGGQRSRSGCLGCRRRKKRCDETKPICQRCQGAGAPCVYPDPISGAFNSRFSISSASEHYTLPTGSSERHFINLNQDDIARLCLSYARHNIHSEHDRTVSLEPDLGYQVPRSMGDMLIDISERQHLQYCEFCHE